MELGSIHLLALILTVAGVIGSGIYSARQVNSAEGFSLGGRSSSAHMIAGAISGTAVGGAATIGTAQLAFLSGLSAWWFTLGSGIGFILLGLFYARPLRQSGLETISQYLVFHYGKATGPLTSLISSLGILFSVVASSLSGVQLLSALFTIPAWQSAFLIVILVVAYVFFGGLKGAGVSGILKLIIIWVTLFTAGAAAVLLLIERADVVDLFPVQPWFSLFGQGISQGLGNLFSLIVGIICTQTYVQAIYSASDAKTAAIGTFVAAVITIPVGLPSVAVGMFMHVYHPDILPILALPLYLIEYLPPWLGGIGVAGLLLSVVGSIAGLVLGVGTMISRDICSDLLKISNTHKLLWANRFAVLLVTLLAMAIALVNLQSLVLDWNFMSMALRGGGIFIPLTLAIFFPGMLRNYWASASMIISTALAICVKILFTLPIPPLFAGVTGSAAIIIIGCFWPGHKKPQEEINEV